MTILIIIVLIIIAVDNYSTSKRLQKENNELKNQIKEMQKTMKENNITQVEKPKTVVTTKNLQNIQEQKNVIKQSQATIVQKTEPKMENIEKAKKDEKERKNISILITGSICIVLAAIVFLMSTWNTIPNIIKTAILALFTLVFFETSHIAKEKLKLEKASKTFFYIAMAYIPICLLSISIFGLLGEYLSIRGPGRYTYLMISAIFVSVIYYKTYKNKNNKYILYGSILSQMFSIISFSLIFSDDIVLIGICLLIYNIVLMLLTKNNLFEKMYNIVPIITTVIGTFAVLNNGELTSVLLLTLAINYLILEYKKTNPTYAYMFNIIAMIFGLYSINLLKNNIDVDMCQLLKLIYPVTLYVTENAIIIKSKRKELIDSLTAVTLTTIGLLHIGSFYINSMIKPYMISTIQVIILIVSSFKYKENLKQFFSILISCYFIASGINILAEIKASYHFYIIFAYLTFIISELLKKKDKKFYNISFIITNIFLALTYFISMVTVFKEISCNPIYALMLVGTYVYCYMQSKMVEFKYTAYILSNYVLYTIFSMLGSTKELFYFIPMITTLGTMLIRKFTKNNKDDIYIAVSQAISFAFIYLTKIGIFDDASKVIAIIFSILIIIDNMKKEKMIYNMVPLIGVIPAIFLNSFEIILQRTLMITTVAISTGLSIKERKKSIYTIFSGIYLVLSCFYINNIYIVEIVFMLWSILHMIFMNKEKDFFKFCSYLSTLFIYNTVIYDIGIEKITVLKFLGYITMAIFTTRTILVKYIKNIDIIEYITFGLIYFYALTQYIDELDGMLFGALIVLIIIISYIKKYGAVFMISIGAILVNIFALTREFWFSIPWWIYLLAIGGTLIGFAIRNEMSDKKEEIKPIEILKKIKDKIEN